MIKIEKLKGVTGFIKRDGRHVTLYVGLLLTHTELETLEANGDGILEYSVDEKEVVTREFKPAPVAPQISTTNKVLGAEATKTTKSGKVIK